MSNDNPYVSGNLLDVWGKNYWDQQPWPKPFLKGKPLLVNDTFVRVDDIPSYAVHSQYGVRSGISVETSNGATYLNPTKCQGFVLRPNDLNYDINMISYPTPTLRFRCMSEREIEEARKDHVFSRSYGHHFKGHYETYTEYKNVPDNKEHGQGDAALRLRAFNLALHRKRQEIASKMAERGLNYDYDKFFNLTYDQGKMKTLFRKTVPPPPPGSNTGREA